MFIGGGLCLCSVIKVDRTYRTILGGAEEKIYDVINEDEARFKAKFRKALEWGC